MKPWRQLVTPQFRETLLQVFPILTHHSDYLQLTSYLLLCPQRERDATDEYTDCILVSGKIVAACAGRLAQYERNNFNHTHYLAQYAADLGLGIRYTEVGADAEGNALLWSYSSRKCLTIEHIDWPEVVCVARQAELALGGRRAGKVILVSGKRPTKQSRRANTEALITEARTEEERAQHPIDAAKLAYHHSLPFGLFDRTVVDNLDAALQVAHGIENEVSRDQSYASLAGVAEDCVPTYKPVAHSPRIFPAALGLGTMKSDVRKVATKSWAEYDLRAAHIAILAAMLNVRPLLKQLPDPKFSYWRFVFEGLGLPLTEENKQKLKPLAHALNYGANKRNISHGWRAKSKHKLKPPAHALNYGANKRNISHDWRKDKKEITRPGLEQLFGAGTGARFFAIPEIGALYQAAQKERGRIALEQKAGIKQYDALGVELHGNPKSILAQQVQRFEAMILHPAYELAEEHREDFYIALNQHDGISVYYRNARTAQRVETMLLAAVNGRAAELGIPAVMEPATGRAVKDIFQEVTQ